MPLIHDEPKIQYWLLKSEPETWSWAQQCEQGWTNWDGVRNYQARNFMQKMQLGDLCLFYHSGSERQIMGIVKVTSTYEPDPTDETGRFGQVRVQTVKSLDHPISLAFIKAHPELQHLALVRQSRLSVMPIDGAAWKILITPY